METQSKDAGTQHHDIMNPSSRPSLQGSFTTLLSYYGLVNALFFWDVFGGLVDLFMQLCELYFLQLQYMLVCHPTPAMYEGSCVPLPCPADGPNMNTIFVC